MHAWEGNDGSHHTHVALSYPLSNLHFSPSLVFSPSLFPAIEDAPPAWWGPLASRKDLMHGQIGVTIQRTDCSYTQAAYPVPLMQYGSLIRRSHIGICNLSSQQSIWEDSLKLFLEFEQHGITHRLRHPLPINPLPLNPLPLPATACSVTLLQPVLATPTFFIRRGPVPVPGNTKLKEHTRLPGLLSMFSRGTSVPDLAVATMLLQLAQHQACPVDLRTLATRMHFSKAGPLGSWGIRKSCILMPLPSRGLW